MDNKVITIRELEPDQWNRCHVNLPIIYEIGGRYYNGYLDSNMIITPESISASMMLCCDINQRYLFKKKMKSLRRIGTKMMVYEDNEKIKSRVLSLERFNISKLNFQHVKNLVDGYDFLKEFQSLTSNNDLVGNHIYNHEDGFKSSVSVFGKSLNNVRMWMNTVMKGFLILLGVIAATSTILILFCCYKNMELIYKFLLSVRTSISGWFRPRRTAQEPVQKISSARDLSEMKVIIQDAEQLSINKSAHIYDKSTNTYDKFYHGTTRSSQINMEIKRVDDNKSEEPSYMNGNFEPSAPIESVDKKSTLTTQNI